MLQYEQVPSLFNTTTTSKPCLFLCKTQQQGNMQQYRDLMRSSPDQRCGPRVVTPDVVNPGQRCGSHVVTPTNAVVLMRSPLTNIVVLMRSSLTNVN
ncbi:hypothetical protein Bpfe_029427 [Biomphalaria pfeifferi]|uniref:Uncharacterized protein n=1 Tax=Biomphalaria pfeifferi TaxID=112525 RepID=A0AAD8ARP7_BIOPF|nr:hypothetical protein Bpfe_029427 [Biomphalaria pfeifferi]